MTELKVDFERESLKDLIYLLEEQAIIEEEFEKQSQDKKPAKIFVIKEKIEQNEDAFLPF